jgi:putative ABC transport system ATP-binding protein
MTFTQQSTQTTPQTGGKGETEALVRITNLERVYQVGSEQVHALRGINLTIQPGQFVAFKGRSGSGKTTLLNLIGGLDQPSSGSVFLFGFDLSKAPESERTRLRRDYLGFVFQSFALIPTYSAFENVELPLRIAGVGSRERRERAMRCLAIVGLQKWANHRPFEMSGGQQQRLSIARALAHHPQLLIADEPTGELDSETGRQILLLFRRLVEHEGVTILMSSHDPTVDEFTSDVYELSDGQIVNHRQRTLPS